MDYQIHLLGQFICQSVLKLPRCQLLRQYQLIWVDLYISHFLLLPSSKCLVTYSFHLPICKTDVTFKLLTYGEKKKLDQRIEKISKYKSESPIFETQERIIAQIQTIAGENDRNFIEKFVRLMPPKDALSLRRYILEVEPGIDYNYEFEGKFTGDFFRQAVTFGIDFFYPRQ